MYLWKIKSLSIALAESRISERMGMQYFLTLTLLGIFSTYLSLWIGAVRNWLFYFELISASAIAIFGCIRAFNANGGDLGHSFILRTTCISVPASIRVLLLNALLFFAFMYFEYENLFTHEYFGNPLRAYTLISYAAFIGLSIYFWEIIVSGISDIKAIERAS